LTHWRQALREGAFSQPNPRCADPPPDGLLAGISLFNAGEYFECHEVLEDIWKAERDPVRYLYQGILQIGVGLHHLRNRNFRGATLLLTDGIEKTSWFTPACMSVDTATLVEQAQHCLDALQNLGSENMATFDWHIAPHITIVTSSAAYRPVRTTITTLSAFDTCVPGFGCWATI
jgi:predicted metal-dependent hydrolase